MAVVRSLGVDIVVEVVVLELAVLEQKNRVVDSLRFELGMAAEDTGEEEQS